MTYAARIPRTVIRAKRKPDPRRSVVHRRFVAAISICLGCGAEGPCEAAHVRNKTDGGTGLRTSDKFTVPLGALGNCGCHHRQHQTGEASFWGALGIDPLDAACRLWTVSGDIEAGRRVIFRARQAIELRGRDNG